MSDRRVVPCVGGVVVDREGRLLVVRRANDPGRGLWSVPGGRVEPGESDGAAVAREVAEETGLTVEVGRLLGRVDLPGPDGTRYDVGDYLCTVAAGALRAGSDADDARWVTPAELRELPVTAGLVEALIGWGALDR